MVGTSLLVALSKQWATEVASWFQERRREARIYMTVPWTSLAGQPLHKSHSTSPSFLWRSSAARLTSNLSTRLYTVQFKPSCSFPSRVLLICILNLFEALVLASLILCYYAGLSCSLSVTFKPTCTPFASFLSSPHSRFITFPML